MRYLDPAYAGCAEAGRSLPEDGGARADSTACTVTMRDGRLLAGGGGGGEGARAPTLDREGFDLIRLAPPAYARVRSLGDPFAFLAQRPDDRAAYFREFEEAVMQRTGAVYVRAFNFVLRRSDIAGMHTLPSGDTSARGAVNDVHTDFTPDAPAVRQLGAMVDHLGLGGLRFTVVNGWRNVAAAPGAVVEQWPLAVCDCSSVRPRDLVPRVSPENGNRIHNLLHSPGHRWFYYPRMAGDEVLLFKQWDSVTDSGTAGPGRARFTPHTAFDAPRGRQGAAGAAGAAGAGALPPRESCELRLLCLFAGGGGSGDSSGGGGGGGGGEAGLSGQHRRALRKLHEQGTGLVAPEALLGGASVSRL
jgi:hypothetical protein